MLKHRASTSVLVQRKRHSVSSGSHSAAMLDHVVDATRDQATKDWLLSEYASVEERFMRRKSNATFPSRKMVDVIAAAKLQSWRFDPFEVIYFLITFFFEKKTFQFNLIFYCYDYCLHFSLFCFVSFMFS